MSEFKSKYSREEITMKGLEIVTHAGEARSNYVFALKAAKEHNWDKFNEYKKIAENEIVEAHRIQTDLLFNESNGEYSDITMIMLHGQDYLMTAILFGEILETLADIYREKK